MPDLEVLLKMRDIGDKERIVIYDGDNSLAREVIFCSSSDSRRDGLLGRKAIGMGDGVLLKIPVGRSGKAGFVTSIHMIGMRFSIAVAWLDEAGVVVHSVLAKPWRPYYGSPRKAWYVLEVHTDLLARLPVGKQLRWERVGKQ